MIVVVKRVGVLDLALGVYRIVWRAGNGASVGCVFCDPHGQRWVACANWVSVCELERVAELAERFELIESAAEIRAAFATPSTNSEKPVGPGGVGVDLR